MRRGPQSPFTCLPASIFCSHHYPCLKFPSPSSLLIKSETTLKGQERQCRQGLLSARPTQVILLFNHHYIISSALQLIKPRSQDKEAFVLSHIARNSRTVTQTQPHLQTHASEKSPEERAPSLTSGPRWSSSSHPSGSQVPEEAETVVSSPLQAGGSPETGHVSCLIDRKELDPPRLRIKDQQTWHFVSRHPSLWKPGAASPRPGNEALSGVGGGQLSETRRQPAREREGGPPSFPGWRAATRCSGWACEGRKGGQENRTEWVLRDRKPETRGRERLTETD